MTQGNTAIFFKPISEKEKWLTAQIVDIAIKIHKALGSGLPESIYRKCFCYELEKRNIPFARQKVVAVKYDNLVVEEGLLIDILVDDLIVIDLKARPDYHFAGQAQLLSCLKLSGKRLGYILNFHVPLMKDGIKRMIYN